MRIFFTIAFCLILLNVSAQISRGGRPLYFTEEFKSLIDSGSQNRFVGKVVVNKVNSNKTNSEIASLKEKLAKERGIGVYAISIDTTINFFESNTRSIKVDSGTFYYLNIKSETANAMQLSFSSFHLVKGSRLFIMSNNSNRFIGSINDRNNMNSKNSFNTFPLKGDELILEYFEPKNSFEKSIIVIDKIVHSFSSDEGPWSVGGGASSCNEPLNVSCPQGYGWEMENKSVGIILFDFTTYPFLNQNTEPPNQYWGYASGVLLNNTTNDGDPLFLTANHAIEDIKNDMNWPIQLSHASNWLILFDYRTETCNSLASNISNQLPISAIQGGVVLNKDNGSKKSDFLLLRLNAFPYEIQQVGATYAGWDASYLGGNKNNFVGIHHPAGDVKKISKGNVIASSTSIVSKIYNDYTEYLWEVEWSMGHTQLGSSGSPLFNSDHKVIGQLFYGYSDCGFTGLKDYYGKFFYTYPNIMLWIDPYNTGNSQCGLYDPAGNNHCQDGILNADEVEMDCGGVDCPPCEWLYGGGGWGGLDHCNNKVQDIMFGELGVDCGGECVPCGNQLLCNDCIKNGDEVSKDCGGSCKPCESGCNSQLVNYTLTSQVITKTITKSKIIAAGNVTISNNNPAEFRANDEILLKDGFQVTSNGSFRALNVDCDCNDICDLDFSRYNDKVYFGMLNYPLCVDVKGAHSFWIRVKAHKARNPGITKVIYETTQDITSPNVCLWNGTGIEFDFYLCDIEIKFFSNCSNEVDYYKIENLTVYQRANSDSTQTTVSNLEFDQLVSLYPNPNQGLFYLLLNSIISGDSFYSVIDESGKLIYDKIKIESYRSKINLIGLPPGVYFVKIDNINSNVYTIKKIVIQ